MNDLLVVTDGVVRGVLIATLAASAVGKLTSKGSTDALTDALSITFGLDRRVSKGAVVLLLTAETISAILLTTPWSARVGSVFATATTGALAIGVAVIVIRKKDVACRCFGGAGSRLSVRHFVRNLLLATCAVVALLSALFSDPAFSVEAYLAICAGAVLALPLIKLDELVALYSPLTRTLEK